MSPSDHAIAITPDEIPGVLSGGTWRRSLKRALITWGLWRSVLSLWGYALWRTGLIRPDAGREWLHGLVPAIEGVRAAWVDIWLRWDTVHYLRIIQFGYGPDERSAFFPLYPLLGKVFGVLTGGDYLLALLLVSNLAAIGCFYALDQLAQIQTPDPKQNRILHNLAFYPAAFFLLVAYPQSLVLFFVLAAYLAQRRQRLFLTFVFGFAAGLTHSTALPLTILLFLGAFGFKRQRWLWFWTACAPLLGIAGFLVWRYTAGFPSFPELLMSIWGKNVGPGVDFAGGMTSLIWLIRGWPNLVVLLLGLGTLYWGFKNRRFAWVGFQAVVLLIPILTGQAAAPLEGMARYALVAFPIYFAISSWLPKGWKRLVILTFAIGGNLYLSGLFILWGFVG
ncbi:MAG: hypothetical protein E4G99_11265 [Anaerolineales bacterium]|nr:MAG: hypothetical protein E4G99_11265 [Anaerolineales bacterium]